MPFNFNHSCSGSGILNRMPLRILLALLVLTAAVYIYPGPVSAQQPAQKVPDVVVMVLSGAFPADVVSFTYSTVVDESTAQSDLNALLNATGWQAAETRITTGAGEPKMTSVEFQTAGVVNWGAGTYPVEPFIAVFKRFDLIQVNYMLQGNFPFRALRSFSNDQVDIIWTGRNTANTYTIKINNHNFDRLNLPLMVQPETPQQQSVEGKQQNGGTNKWIIVVLAIVAGTATFFIVNRMSRNERSTQAK